MGGLARQLAHPFLAGTGDGLVGRHVDATDAYLVVQGLERHQHLDGGAVGVGDDVAVAKIGQRVRVHFRNDQGNVLVVAEAGGVVDDDAAVLGGDGRPFGRDLGTGGEECNLHLAPVKGLHVKDVDVLAAKTHRVPSAATGGERIESRYREGALLQDLDHGLTHGAAGTQYRYVELLTH